MGDNLKGVLLMVGSIVALLLYGFFVFFTGYSFWLIAVTAFVVVAGMLVITAWIGYTLYSTPPLVPLDLPMDEIEEAGG